MPSSSALFIMFSKKTAGGRSFDKVGSPKD